MKLSDLTELQIDALRECGSIGAGHAATALSQLVDHRVDLEMPTVDLMSVRDIPRIFGGAETLTAASYARLLGDLSGSIVFIVDRPSALGLAEMLHSGEGEASKSLTHDGEAMLSHTASILMTAYLIAIGRLANLTILPSATAFSFDMVGGILEAVAMEIGLRTDEALVIRTEFFSEGDDGPSSVDAYLFFLPDAEGLELLLGHLGIS
jgi:chemotaxis protein CheC